MVVNAGEVGGEGSGSCSSQRLVSITPVFCGETLGTCDTFPCALRLSVCPFRSVDEPHPMCEAVGIFLGCRQRIECETVARVRYHRCHARRGHQEKKNRYARRHELLAGTRSAARFALAPCTPRTSTASSPGTHSSSHPLPYSKEPQTACKPPPRWAMATPVGGSGHIQSPNWAARGTRHPPR